MSNVFRHAHVQPIYADKDRLHRNNLTVYLVHRQVQVNNQVAVWVSVSYENNFAL